MLEITSRILERFGEFVHPGKTESVALGKHGSRDPPVPLGCSRVAKLLGSLFDGMNEMADDTHHCLEGEDNLEAPRPDPLAPDHVVLCGRVSVVRV